MTRHLICLLFAAAVAAANPVVEFYFSEIQVAPDSLERIELHMYSNERPYPVDLSGWNLTTNAGAATLDSGIVLQDSMDFAIISRENVNGPFALGDDSDDIWLTDPSGPSQDHYEYGTYGWTPPPDMSVAIYTHREGIWPDDYLVGEWYLDSTPTFGAPNDDYHGGIAGRVLDRFGNPLPWCSVSFSNAWGSAYTGCDSTGRYVMSPLGPGTFEVRAHSDSTYLPMYYPESVSIGVNGFRDSVNMTLYPVGVSESREAGPFAVLLQRGRRLVLNTGRAGEALLTVHDNLGRVRMSEKVTLVEGRNELALPSLRGGVYFANCRFGGRTLNTKFVLY